MEVKVGQIWKDNDARYKGRTVRVVEIQDNNVLAAIITDVGGRHVKVPRIARLPASRFSPEHKGYTLVRNV